MNIVLILLLILFLTCAGVVFKLMRGAVIGFEDCNGFHRGEPPSGYKTCANCQDRAICRRR